MSVKVIPVIDAPLSVTVAAPTCSEAGMWATLAMLQGKHAENFLENESDRKHWIQR